MQTASDYRLQQNLVLRILHVLKTLLINLEFVTKGNPEKTICHLLWEVCSSIINCREVGWHVLPLGHWPPQHDWWLTPFPLRQHCSEPGSTRAIHFLLFKIPFQWGKMNHERWKSLLGYPDHSSQEPWSMGNFYRAINILIVINNILEANHSFRLGVSHWTFIVRFWVIQFLSSLVNVMISWKRWKKKKIREETVQICRKLHVSKSKLAPQVQCY